MNDFENLSISSAIEGLANKNFTSLELTEFFIKKIEKNKDLNCFITSTFDKAIEMAKKFRPKNQRKRNKTIRRNTHRNEGSFLH